MSTSPVVDLVIDKRSAGPLLSWCPRTNLLAVQVSAEQGRLGVCIVDPSTPEVKIAIVSTTRAQQLATHFSAGCRRQSQLTFQALARQSNCSIWPGLP